MIKDFPNCSQLLEPDMRIVVSLQLVYFHLSLFQHQEAYSIKFYIETNKMKMKLRLMFALALRLHCGREVYKRENL